MRVHRLVDLGVRQRPFRRAERETERKADAAVRHALAAVAIELDRVREQRGRCRADSATNGGRRQGAIDEHREIAHDRREARQRFGAQVGARLPSLQARRRRARTPTALRRREAARVENRRRDLADDADAAADPSGAHDELAAVACPRPEYGDADAGS